MLLRTLGEIGNCKVRWEEARSVSDPVTALICQTRSSCLLTLPASLPDTVMSRPVYDGNGQVLAEYEQLGGQPTPQDHAFAGPARTPLHASHRATPYDNPSRFAQPSFRDLENDEYDYPSPPLATSSPALLSRSGSSRSSLGSVDLGAGSRQTQGQLSRSPLRPRPAPNTPASSILTMPQHLDQLIDASKLDPRRQEIHDFAKVRCYISLEWLSR